VYAIGKIIDGIFKVVEMLVFFFFALMVILVFAQVFNRFVTNNTLTWSEELSRYLMIWLTFLGAAIVYREDGHMKVENLVNALKGSANKIVRGLSIVAQILFIGLLIWGAYVVLPVVSIQYSPSNNINMVIPYTALVVNAMLMSMVLFEKFFVKRKIKEIKEGENNE
jgi:TRAP-type C4-dicarboxylate transport system permease small subunit